MVPLFASEVVSVGNATPAGTAWDTPLSRSSESAAKINT